MAATDNITYRRLDDALRALGFHRHAVNGSIIYDKADSRAVIALPAMSPDTTVLPRHLAAARSEVVGMGLADESEFDRVLAPADARTPAAN
jgi:hypothetical protein